MREHGPGAEPSVAARRRLVVPVVRGGVAAQRGQAGQVEVGGAGAHDGPGGDRGASGIGNQGLIDAWRVVGRPQHDAVAGEQGQCPWVEHVGAHGSESGADELVQPTAGLLGSAVGSLDLD